MIAEVLVVVVMFAIVLGGLVYQRRSGLFTAAAFADSPPRSGRFGLHDIVITIGLWLFGSSLGVLAAQQLVGDDPSSFGIFVQTLLSQVGAMVGVGYVFARAAMVVDRGVRGLGFNADQFGRSLDRTIAVGLFIVPATFVTLAVMALATTAVGYPPPRIAHTMLEAIRDADSTPVAIGLLALPIFLAPLIEETLFRGMMQTALRHTTMLGVWPVILSTSMLFALIHLPAVPWQSLPGLFVLSVGLGFAYERTGKLWAPMLIHGLFNAINVTLVLTGLVVE